MSHRRLRPRLLAVVVLLAALVPTATAAAGSPVRTETSPTVEVSVTALSPTVLPAGTDLRITATLTNSGTTALAEPRVLVHLRRTGFVSRSSLDVWREAGPYDDLGSLVLTEDLDDPLEAGGSTTVTLTVPAENLGLPGNSWSWGARGLGLELVDVADSSRLRQGVARTFVIWYPVANDQRTDLSVLVPVTGPAPGEDAAQRIADLTAPGARLGDLLAATDTAGVTWAVDPWLLTTARAQVGGSATGPARWAETFVGATADQDVVVLPWGDADVSALVHDDATDLLTLAEERARAAAADLGVTAGIELVLPGEDLPDLAVAGWAAGAGRPVVVGPGELAAPTVLTYTPSGQTTVATAEGDAVVLVPDERLTTGLVVGSVLGTGTAGNDAAPTGATAAADLLAELAVITRERPADPRQMLISAPRDWDPDPAVVGAALTQLADAPFVNLAGLDELAGRSNEIERGTLPEGERSDAEVDAATLAEVEDAITQRVELTSMTSDPEAFLGDLDAERLAPAALAWRADPAGRSVLVQSSVERTEALRESVGVPETSTVNLLSSSGELPVQVENDLDQEVTLEVRLRPSDARLVARDTVEVVVPPESATTASVPVHGVQSGDVQVTVQLLTPDGVLVDDATTLTVRVRAEWESIGTAVIAGVLALGFVTGLVRTIRRGRRRGRASATEVTP